MSIEKIFKIILSELVEAAFFGTLITVCNEFSKSLPIFDSCSSVYLFWITMGLVTPFVIWLEMEEELIHFIDNFFKH